MFKKNNEKITKIEQSKRVGLQIFNKLKQKAESTNFQVKLENNFIPRVEDDPSKENIKEDLFVIHAPRKIDKVDSINDMPHNLFKLIQNHYMKGIDSTKSHKSNDNKENFCVGINNIKELVSKNSIKTNTVCDKKIKAKKKNGFFLFRCFTCM
jgi:hypothetical protein